MRLSAVFLHLLLHWSVLGCRAQHTPKRANDSITAAEVAIHQNRTSMWAVIDGRWVVNVTGFLPHHPGGIDKVLGATLDGGFSFLHGDNAHFAATADVFAEALHRYEAQPLPMPMDFVFWRSRANGGLNKDGQPTGARPASPVGTATIMGRLVPDSGQAAAI
jgi:hypothetical protein